MKIQDYIAEIADFPKKGVSFKDITPILNSPEAFKYVVDKMARFVKTTHANVIVAPEARGFVFAAPVAYAAHTGLVLIRKAGKLPRPTFKRDYNLEYGQATLEMHKTDLKAGDKVVIVDDVLASGGTIETITKLVEESGAEVVGISVVANLTFLHPPELCTNLKFQSLVTY